MEKEKTNQTLAIEHDEEILASHDFNDERTVAFHSIKKKHKKDSIGWIIGGLLLFFFMLISLGRITIVGQFFDDSIFNLIFGWFKFPVYFLLLVLDLCIYLGIYFKFKKRFLLMIGLTAVLICWIISLTLMTYIYENEKVIAGYTVDGLWSKRMLPNSFQIYWGNWFEHSIYASDYAKSDKMELLISSRGYINLYGGGGVIGTLCASVSAYLSIPGAFILIGVLLFLDFCWLFTGDGFFFFKPKTKRKGHALRILSLKGKNNPNKKKSKKTPANEDYQIWKSLNVFDPNVQAEIATSDLTIELPSFNEAEQNLNLKELDEDYSLEKSNSAKNFQPLFANQSAVDVLTKPTLVPDSTSVSEKPVYQSRRKKALEDLKNWDREAENSRVSYQDIEDMIKSSPQAGHFGDLDPNDARELFAKETAITPFGRKSNHVQSLDVDDDDDESDTQFFADLYGSDLTSLGDQSKSKK